MPYASTTSVYAFGAILSVEVGNKMLGFNGRRNKPLLKIDAMTNRPILKTDAMRNVERTQLICQSFGSKLERRGGGEMDSSEDATSEV